MKNKRFREYKMLPDGRLDNNNLKSEYERGYVDCWNESINLSDPKFVIDALEKQGWEIH